MFSRFRNFFSKSKSEKSPEPEKTREAEKLSEPENSRKSLSAQNENVKKPALAALDSVSLENAELSNIPKAALIKSSSSEKCKELAHKSTKPNEVQEFASVPTAIVSSETSSKSTLVASQSKNKTEESVNISQNGGKEEKDSARNVKIDEATCSTRVAADNGNRVQELVTADKTLIEVSAQLNEVNVKQNEREFGKVRSAKETNKEEDKYEVSSLFENLNSLLAQVGSKIAAKPTVPTNETLLQPLVVANVDKTLDISSSITVDELTTDASSPASGNTIQSSSTDGTAASDASTADSGSIVIQPTGNNAIACSAISHKLQDISEVAESLDAAIRDVQQDAEALEMNAASNADKKREAMRSNSSEDWQSRSTEDDSFVTASECTFTPQSHSSSYQTASGRTSSFISSGKNSFDLSEADDPTFASTYDIPADINMSFDGSEQSFVSAQQQETDASTPQQQQENQQNQKHLKEDQSSEGAHASPVTDNEDNVGGVDNADGSSIADIEELHSQSVTPTPGDGDVEQYHFQSIPVESETEFDSSCIVDSPSMEILTETMPVTSVTPEVSTCLNIEHQQPQQQQTQNPNNNTNNNNNNNNTNSQKPNAAWRRSKYYENITKQTIKGFL